MVRPVKAKPTHIALDGLDIRFFLFRRVGVIEPQMALPTKLGSDSKVQADGFCMTDMEVAIRLRRKARNHRLVNPTRQILAHDLADKVVLFEAVGISRIGQKYSEVGGAAGPVQMTGKSEILEGDRGFEPRTR